MLDYIKKDDVVRAFEALLSNETIKGGCKQAITDLENVILKLPVVRVKTVDMGDFNLPHNS